MWTVQHRPYLIKKKKETVLMTNNLQRFGEIPTPEYKKIKVTLIFNRLNGLFISVTDLPIELCDPNDLYCIYVEDKMDLNSEEVTGKLIINEDGTWEADYKIGNVREGTFRVYESQLNSTVAYKITKEYPVVRQVNILAKIIKELADKSGVDTSELDEYLDYVKLVKDTNKAHKEFYKNNPEVEYISNVEQSEIEIAQYEGGLHEIIGPRTVGGGIVF